MSKKQYADAVVLCPFYRYYERGMRRIGCEGAAADSVMLTTWRYANQSDRHFSCYCCGKFESCRMYRLVATKYED